MATVQGKGTGAPALVAQCEGEADALFARMGVDDVRRVVAQTRADAAARSDALRAFVGEHHTDLVRVAEAVVALTDVAGGVLTDINNPDAATRAKTETTTTPPQPQVQQHAVCDVARLLRMVVSAPERVAALADRGEYLAAAIAHHRAGRAHAALASKDAASRRLCAAVPLATRQWAALAAVPPALAARCCSALAERANSEAPQPLTPARATSALGALLVLRRDAPEALVREYFARRAEAVLLPCTAEEEESEALATVAARFVATLELADALFGTQQQQQRALMDRVVARLPESLTEGTGVPFIAPSVVQHLCDEWLADAQTQVRAAVRERLARVTSLAALGRAAEAIERRLGGHALPGRTLDVWDALFAAPFEERAAALVAAHTSTLTSRIETLVTNLVAPAPGDEDDEEDKNEEENEEERENNKRRKQMEQQQQPWNAPMIPDLDAIGRLQDGAATTVTSGNTPVAAFVRELNEAVEKVRADVAAVARCARFSGVREAAAATLSAAVEALAHALATRVDDPKCTCAGVLRSGEAARAAAAPLPALARLGALCDTAPDRAPLARVHGTALAAWTRRTLTRPLAAFRTALAAVPWAERTAARALARTFEVPPSPSDAPALPAFLTPCLASLLWDVAAAVAHAHGPALPRAGARFLARALSDGALAAYDAVLAPLAHADPPPEAAVQLWFDVYALGELFCARAAPPADALDDPAARALAIALQSDGDSSEDDWPTRVAHTIAAAQALLDPVEFGYFRPHMRAAVARALQRSALVYAVYNPALCTGSSTTTTATTTTTTSEAATALPCARVAGRFALLPSTSSIPVAAAALAAPWPAVTPLRMSHSAASAAGNVTPLAASAPAQRTQRDDALLMAMGSFF